MSDTEEADKIGTMHIDMQSKEHLRGSLLSRVGTAMHLAAIDSCVEHEEHSNNEVGILDLLKLRLKVMRGCPEGSFADEAFAELIERIQLLEISEFNRIQDAKRAERATQIQQAGIATLVEESPRYGATGRRPTKSRRSW